MKKDNLINIVDRFNGKKISVIGDLMLDRFVSGDVERISPEAPIPVFLSQKETYVLGGAANTAHNISALGGTVFLVGVLGNDAEGKTLLHEAKKSAISVAGIAVVPGRSTTQKTRLVAKGQQIVRIDKEDISPINKKTESSALAFIAKNMPNWDGIIVSDYGKGFITEKLAKGILALAKKHKKLVVGDIKPSVHAQYFKGVHLLTPNTKEALALSQTDTVQAAGKKIQQELSCDVLITRGAEGMTLFEGKKITHFSSLAKEVVDVVGAGDTVAAAFCLALASGATMQESMVVSSHAARVVVNKAGTAVVTVEELMKSLDDEK